MFFVLLTFTLYVLAIVAKNGFKTVTKGNYGSALETYIISKKPQNVAEVERLTREFHSSPKWIQSF